MLGTITHIISPPLRKELIIYLSTPHRQLPGLIFTIDIEHCPDMLDGCTHAKKREFLENWVAAALLFLQYTYLI